MNYLVFVLSSIIKSVNLSNLSFNAFIKWGYVASVNLSILSWFKLYVVISLRDYNEVSLDDS